MTKFGIEQVSSIPPLWWRKFERAVIVGLAPAVILLANKIITDPYVLASVTSYVGFGLGLIKTIGIFMGSESDYPKEEVVVEEPKDDLNIEKE